MIIFNNTLILQNYLKNSNFSSMGKNKYYVVWEGREVGIFTSWDKCKKSIDNFQGAKYKSFDNAISAKEAYQTGYQVYIKKAALEKHKIEAQQKQLVSKLITDSICVDAACNVSTQLMEYRGVFLRTRKVLFHRGPYEGGSNNIGEFLAIVHAMAFMKQNKLNYPIYTDSQTAISWVKKREVKTKVSTSPIVEHLISKALEWLNSNSVNYPLLKWDTSVLGEIPADFGRK